MSLQQQVELKKEQKEQFKCPTCGIDLSYFSGLEGIPEHLFCPVCTDWAYDVSSGEKRFRLE